MVTQASPHARRLAGRIFLAGRQASLSAQIVADARHALIDKQLKPGDFVGTEKDIAARYGVSRIVARDALRSLEALGIVEIRMGKGGGARVAHGNPRLFGEALAGQRDLAGELAAENATGSDIARLKTCLADAKAKLSDVPAFTESCRDFHLAVAEASHNRVLVVQLISLQHVSWPADNRTLTPKVARRVLDVHHELTALIEMRDAAGARRLMDDHVRMIRARRVAEHAQAARRNCC